jgi:hypothetical protein
LPRSCGSGYWNASGWRYWSYHGRGCHGRRYHGRGCHGWRGHGWRGYYRRGYYRRGYYRRGYYRRGYYRRGYYRRGYYRRNHGGRCHGGRVDIKVRSWTNVSRLVRVCARRKAVFVAVVVGLANLVPVDPGEPVY